jgi:hypothetical protein
MGNGKTYCGDPGKMFESDEWEHQATWVDDDEGGIKWFVFSKRQPHSESWRTYKVVANGRVTKKANYWFAYDHDSGWLAFANDVMAMQKYRPKMYAFLMNEFLKDVTIA